MPEAGRARACRILGVDPGTVATGWGLVEQSGRKLAALGAGVVRAPKAESLEARLVLMHDGLESVIEAHRPEVVVVEEVFFAKHANAALKLGHVRGVVLLVAARRGLRVASYPPSVVKRAVAGRGAADKEQLARIVAAILGLRDLPAHDATDALALALTHAQAGGLAGLGGRRPGR